MTRISNNRTSVLINDQLPEFVRSEHTRFVEFIESYYKFLEDKNYYKAINTGLSAATEIGLDKPFHTTNTVLISDNLNTVPVVVKVGSIVNVDGNKATITGFIGGPNVWIDTANSSNIIGVVGVVPPSTITRLNTYGKIVVSNTHSPNARTITVTPAVPTKMVQGDFYVYDSRVSPNGSDLMNMTKNFNRYLDIDVAAENDEKIKQKLYDNFIKYIPSGILADKNLILKHAKEFYRSRGSEASVKFLIRALFGKEAEFYYPKRDILRASDGKWYVQKALRITDVMVSDTFIPNIEETPIFSTSPAGSLPPSGPVGSLLNVLADFSDELDGVAITFLDTKYGTWYYSLNNGSTWTQITKVLTDQSALLLNADASTRLYFRPVSSYRGIIYPAITFRDWIRRNGGVVNTYVDTDFNGDGTPYSSAKYSASIIVNQINEDDTLITRSLSTNFKKRTVRGSLSKAAAIVEDINTYYNKGELVTELKISNPIKTFLSDEYIYTTFEQDGIEKTIYARIFGGQIIDVDILNGGTGYEQDTIIPLIRTSNTGSGARLVISRVTRGSIKNIFTGTGNILTVPDVGGVGYQASDPIYVSGGGGTGAIASVQDTWLDVYHPNTYMMVGSTIDTVAGVALVDYGYEPSVYGNLNIANTETVANTAISNAVNYWEFAGAGPIRFVQVDEEGQDYISVPSFLPQANTYVKSLGILGKLKVVNGGRGYVPGDTITFTNPLKANSYGFGALANVTVTNATGAIINVAFKEMPGHIVGGSGYDQFNLPTAKVNSSNVNATGAVILVESTLGYGGTFSYRTEEQGIIRQIKIIAEGTAYTSPPTLDLTGLGDGTAQVTCTVVTGIYNYPGRYINDDGFVSAQNFLQDRDYYQNFSYEVIVDKPINTYRSTLKNLTHPAGMKMFGRYLYTDVEQATMNVSQVFSTAYDLDAVSSGITFHINGANNLPVTGVSNVWRNFAPLSQTGTLNYGTPVGAALKTGYAEFDGVTDYITFPGYSALNSSSFAVELWIAPDILAQTGTILEKGLRNSQYSIRMEASNLRFKGRINNTSAGWINILSVDTDTTLQAGKWNQLIINFSNSNQQMFVNGVRQHSNNLKSNLLTNTSGITLGGSGGYGTANKYHQDYYKGKISIVRIYNRLLSSTEILRNFQAEKNRFGL